MKLYHGTTRAAFDNIMQHGFDNFQKQTWFASHPGITYFWNPAQLLESGEADDEQGAKERAIQLAFESAQISAAIANSNDTEIVVIEYEYDDSDGPPTPDESCENMDYGACEVQDACPLNITGYYTSTYIPQFAPFVLVGLLDNKHIRLDRLNPTFVKALERLRNVDFYLDELMEFELDNYTEIAPMVDRTYEMQELSGDAF